MNWSVFRICFAIFQCAKYIGIWRRSLGNMRTNVRARIGREFRIWPEIWTSFGMSFSVADRENVAQSQSLFAWNFVWICSEIELQVSQKYGLSRFVAQALFALRWNEGENAPPQLLKRAILYNWEYQNVSDKLAWAIRYNPNRLGACRPSLRYVWHSLSTGL